MKKVALIYVLLMFTLSGCGPIYKGTIVCTKVYDEKSYHTLEWNYVENLFYSTRDTLVVPVEFIDLGGATYDVIMEKYRSNWEEVNGTFNAYIDEEGYSHTEGYVDYTMTDRELIRDKGFWMGIRDVFRIHENDGYTCEKYPEFDPDRI